MIQQSIAKKLTRQKIVPFSNPEGDAHMPWHIIVCLTTHAVGDYMIAVVDCGFPFKIVVCTELVDIPCVQANWIIVVWKLV